MDALQRDTVDDDLAVYAVHIEHEAGETTKYVRASSTQRAKWWAREQFPQGVVRWADRRDATEADDVEIVDVGGWEDE